MGALELIEELLHLAKLATHLLHVVRIATHSHEACDAYMLQLAPRLGSKQGAALVNGKAILGILLGNVYLQQAVDDAIVLSGMLVNLSQ